MEHQYQYISFHRMSKMMKILDYYPSLFVRLTFEDFGCLDSAHHVMMTDIIQPQMSQKFLMIPSLES